MERIFQNRNLIMGLENWEKRVHKILDQKKLKETKTNEIKSNIFIKYSKKKCLISKIW